jgi:hypothetical protein
MQSAAHKARNAQGYQGKGKGRFSKEELDKAVADAVAAAIKKEGKKVKKEKGKKNEEIMVVEEEDINRQVNLIQNLLSSILLA